MAMVNHLQQIGVSSGTCVLLGLSKETVLTLPTTAYLLIGQGCNNLCDFCPQGALNNHPQNRLSRISWPLYNWELVRDLLIEKTQNSSLRRICFQVTAQKNNFSKLQAYVNDLAAVSIPINASVEIKTYQQGAMLLNSGLQRISLAFDAAESKLYKDIKKKNWLEHWQLIQNLAQDFPHRIATHLIVGLGETEENMFRMIKKLIDLKIEVGLFAFTPVRGTAMKDHPQPDLNYFRRVQLFKHLYGRGNLIWDHIKFKNDSLYSWGLDFLTIKSLTTNEAFQTAGCPDCNRPYYNEKPGGIIYSYPYPLDEIEFSQALRAAYKTTI